MKGITKYFIILTCIYLLGACKEEQFTIDSEHKIEIDADTLWFDTVFSKVNKSTPKSVNKQIIITNPHTKSIKTNIELIGGITSHFRLNVDGEPGYSFKDVEIFPNDSIFMFVEVHPSENNNSPDFNPLIIRDSILLNTNNNEQKVNLIGWGQDAHYIFRDSIENDTTWENNKLPIVVYGYCYVKPDVSLTIKEGMNIHFAPYSWLFVEGKVNIEGSAQNKVLLQGDRLQPDWEETSGQWGGIWLNWPTQDNYIEHAIIKNGTVGIYCDTISGNANVPNVTVKKSFIRNMSFDGIAGRGSNIKVENTISANCGRYTFLGSYGGDYDIKNSTFYTGSGDFSRNGPTFGYSNIVRDEFQNIISTHSLKFNFINNIIYGINSEGEIGDDLDGSKIDPESVLDYNLLRSKDPKYITKGSHNIVDSTPLFINKMELNLELDSLSPAKDKGIILNPNISNDYFDRTRDSKPDLGAFESRF